MVENDNGRAEDAGVARAIARIHADLGAPHSVATLAKIAAASRAAFVRRFVADVGTAPMRYVTEQRLGRAAERLAEGRRPLAEIAAEVGYANEFALARAFKRHFGVAPGVYRRGATGTVARAA